MCLSINIAHLNGLHEYLDLIRFYLLYIAHIYQE